jgi:phosphohistidine phosphatase
MHLLLIRHAIATPAVGTRDEDRPLTPEGEQRFRDTARMLARVAQKPAAILSSPLLRARQTAAIAAQAWGDIRPKVVPALADGRWPEICRALAAHDDADTVALVGHESWLSTLTARFLGSRRGGALLWFIPPRVFRRLE